MKALDKFKKVSLVVVVLLSGYACNQDTFLDVNNENELVAENFYTNITNFNNATTSVYSALKSLDLFGQAFYIRLYWLFRMNLIIGMRSAGMK